MFTGVLSAVSGLAAGPAVLAAVSLATRRRLWQIGVVGVLSVDRAGRPSSRSSRCRTTSRSWLTLTVNTIFTAGVLGWGMYIGSRRELMWTLRHRAERAEAEQELRVAQARANERAGIAREMHDVLAHRISQISMHAGALAFREDLTAEQMRANAAVIQATAHDALTDLRGVLGVLRDAHTGEPLDQPQPTYADLPRLVAEAQESGLAIEYDDLVERRRRRPGRGRAGRSTGSSRRASPTPASTRPAPGSASRSAAPPTTASTSCCATRSASARPRRPASGLGLIGLSERAELRGGRLEYAPRRSHVRAARVDTVGDMTESATRVLIVDDDPLVRSALALMLGGQADLDVVGEAGDGREGVDQARRLAPDVVLMDIRMPRLNGLDATRELHARPEPPRVIVLTTFDADDYVFGALAAGADGFLLKDTPPAEIVAAIRKVAAGEPMLSPSVTRTVLHRHAHRGQRRTRPTRPRPGWPASPTASARSRSPSGADSATPRSPPSSTCRCRPSRPTCRGSSTSCTSPTGSRSRSASTTPAWSDRRDGWFRDGPRAALLNQR